LPNADPPFLLQTFGTLRLVRLNGDAVLGDHGHHRRRIALLAVLAAAGDRGRSRDQLLGLFWPDVSQSRARHSLDQLLYAIRTSLDGDVFTGSSSLQLNPDLIDSDVRSFNEAIARGDLEEAVNRYNGPFLDGFYLNDSPDFEQWMDAERSRLERGYIEALEQLAKKSAQIDDLASSARWLEKLVDTDPVSARHAVALIRALSDSGDHAAALRYAERYESIVSQELGTSVGPEVAKVVTEVRERAKTGSVVRRNPAAPSRLRPEKLETETAEIAETPSSQLGVVDAPSRLERRTNYYALAALAFIVIAVVAAAFRWRSVQAPTTTSSLSSLAVLPLANVSGDPRDLPIVDGLTEELIGVLSKIDGLRVTARTSAFVFRNSGLDVRKIADSLRVGYIIEGGVQRVGDRMRVQIRLVDAADASTRWSEIFERQTTDVFLVQSEIASAVARELDLRLAPRTAATIRRRPTNNVGAYEFYLRGSDPAVLRSDSAARKGLEYFQQAIALDSTYAAAYAGLARMYLRVNGTPFSPARSRKEGLGLASAAAMKALALDDSLAEGHAAYGLTLIFKPDVSGAERELRRAVALDPRNSRIHEWLGFVESWRMNDADALAEARAAVEMDPLSPSAHAEVARTLCATGQVDEGLRELEQIASVKPPLGRAKLHTFLCHCMRKDWKTAAAIFRNEPVNPHLAFALAKGGEREEAEAILDRLKKRAGEGGSTFNVAIVYAGLGNMDETFAWLNRAVDDMSFMSTGFTILPVLDDVRKDPRFDLLSRRLRL
jgi:adenylate cyclase